MLSRFVSSPSVDEHRRSLVPAAFKLTADAVSKGVTLVVFVTAARLLSTAELGVLAMAMTTGWLLSVASDAGLPLDLAREVARRATAGTSDRSIVWDAMRWRGRLGVAAVGVGAVAAVWLAPPSLRLAFTLIVTAQLLIATLETLSHAFRGLGRIDIDARVTLWQRTATGFLACGVLLAHPSLAWLAVALVVPPALALGVSLAVVQRILPAGDGPRGAEQNRLSERFLHDVAPMGLGIFLSALYFRCDVYFIERWHGLETVGLYNATFRLVEALRLVPAALMAVVFPLYCTTRSLGPLTRSVMWLLGAAAVPVLALLVAPTSILGFVYGAPFTAAAPALGLLALAVPLFFVNYALTHQVIAWDGQRAYLAIVFTALVTSVAANLMLVPSGGMRGAAAATLVTEIVVGLGCATTLAVQRSRARRDDRIARVRVADGPHLPPATVPGDPA